MHRDTITVGILIYHDPRWLSFVLDGLEAARTEHVHWRPYVYANDPTPAVAADHRVTFVHRSQDPSVHYLTRVYQAWNDLVRRSPTELVVLLNSDMVVSDGWLDSLYAAWQVDPKALPTSLLVESGRQVSAFPEYVANFGLHPNEFDATAWRQHAALIREPGRTSKGRLYMPVLFQRDAFLAVGGYPPGNLSATQTGDRVLFQRLADAGFRHVTCHGSVVYHVGEGEMRDAAANRRRV